jgi:hypothetical protein
MKKIFALAAVATCCLAFAGCAKNADSECGGGGAGCSAKLEKGGKCCGTCGSKKGASCCGTCGGASKNVAPAMMGEKTEGCSSKKACSSACPAMAK